MRSEYVSPEETRQLAPQLSKANRLVLDICGATGLRVGDVVALRTDQMRAARTGRGWLRVRESKTGKTRSVRVPIDTIDRVLAQAGPVYVFTHRDDAQRHRTRQAVWAQLRRKAAALPQHVSPHSYRKLYAVQQFRQLGDLDKVRQRLAHDNVGVTALYATSDVQAAVAAARAKNKRNHRKGV